MVREAERHDGRFGDRIRVGRLEQALSQKEVADLAGISVRTYREWEHGRAVPFPGRNLRAISAVLRKPVRYLLHGEEDDAFD